MAFRYALILASMMSVLSPLPVHRLAVFAKELYGDFPQGVFPSVTEWIV
jgi:hypothetical protein